MGYTKGKGNKLKLYTKRKFEKIIPWFEAINLNLLEAPISIVLLVTDDCPCSCNMCTHWQMDTKYQMDYETFRSILLNCQSKGTQSVFLSGGDCFYWREWERFLEDEEIKLAVQITTPLIYPKDFNVSLLKRLKWIRISLDAIREESYKQIRGIDAMSVVKHNIEELVVSNLVEDIGITTVLQKDNYEEIIEMAKWIEAVGIKRWIIVPVNYFEELRIPHEKVVELGIKLLCEYGQKIPINNWDVLASDWQEFRGSVNLPCIIPRMEAFIDTRLRVWPCCNIAQDSMGDENRVDWMQLGQFKPGSRAGADFLEIWKKHRNLLEKFTDFKKIHPLCDYTCRFKYFYYNLGFAHCKETRQIIYI